MQLKDKETKKLEKIDKLRAAKSKDIKKKAEQLNTLIKEKQRSKRTAERELVQNSLKQFREVVEKGKEKEAEELKTRSGSLPKTHLQDTGSEQLLDEIFEQVKMFYDRYDQETVEIRDRIQAQIMERLKLLDKRCNRTHSEPRGDKADQLANAYIKKIKKYD